MDNLAVALPVFFATAAIVVAAGIVLARSGDAIAERTGWGTLWVGTVLVSVATSLPELVINVSAVLIETPALALGNVFGANMVNILTVTIIALVFGIRNVFSGQPGDTQMLVLFAVVLAIVVLGIGVSGDFDLGPTSAGGLVVAAAYIGGMRLVYAAGHRERGEAPEQDVATPAGGSGAWAGFAGASAAIFIAAPLLAMSADGIAVATGLGASFIGVLAVSIVTTLPEASVTFTAAYRKSYGLVLGNVYGSCAFNLFVIPFADLFHGGPLLTEMGPEHFVALGTAIVLMSFGFMIIRSYQHRLIAGLRHLAYAVPVIYVGALYWVFVLSQAGVRP